MEQYIVKEILFQTLNQKYLEKQELYISIFDCLKTKKLSINLKNDISFE